MKGFSTQVILSCSIHLGFVMIIEKYALYVFVASLTIASPGPGVVLSIANSIKYGVSAAIPGIIGISMGMFVISVVAASGVGTIILASPIAFSVLKYVGCAYLIYLAYKLWKSKEVGFKSIVSADETISINPINRFKQGLFITLLNPKPMIFFIALFPQFINMGESYIGQFGLLSGTFCALIVIIHFVYAYFSGSIGKWISQSKGHQLINRISSVCFFNIRAKYCFY